jgi:hypothetical protein
MKKSIEDKVFYLIFILLFISIKCTPPNTSSYNTIDSNIDTYSLYSREVNSNKSLNAEKNNNLVRATSFGNLEGTWFYSNYIDSTIINKKIYDYIDYFPRDRYEITFRDDKPDTAFVKGYWESYYIKLTKVGENTYKTYGDTLQLIKLGDTYVLNYITEYEEKKCYFIKKDIVISDIKEYFAKNIFSGEYYDMDRNKKVIFHDDFSITGIDKVTSYWLSEGFSEYSDGMDILSLNGLRSFYYWRFNRDTLILQRAYPVEDDGGPNGFELGEVDFKLLKYN